MSAAISHGANGSTFLISQESDTAFLRRKGARRLPEGARESSPVEMAVQAVDGCGLRPMTK